MVVRRLDQPYSGDATVALAPQRGFHERPSYPVVLGGRIDRDGAEARDRVALVDERTPHYLARAFTLFFGEHLPRIERRVPIADDASFVDAPRPRDVSDLS